MDRIARRQRDRARRHRYTLLAVCSLATTGLVCVAVSGYAIWRSQSRLGPGGPGLASAIAASVAGPSEGKEGLDWNNADLLRYLGTRGLPTEYTVHVDSQGDRVSWAVDAYPPGNSALIGTPACPPRVVIELRPDARAAHDLAGVPGEPRFSWGRFLIRSKDQARLKQFRDRLP